MRRAAHPSGCARCGAGAGRSAIKYQFLSRPCQQQLPVSGFESRVSGSRFRVSGFGFQGFGVSRETVRWTGLAPWYFEFPFSGSLTSTCLKGGHTLSAAAAWRSAEKLPAVDSLSAACPQPRFHLRILQTGYETALLFVY